MRHMAIFLFMCLASLLSQQNAFANTSTIAAAVPGVYPGYQITNTTETLQEPSTVTIEVSLNALTLSPVDGTQATKVTADGFGKIGIQGMPDLPAYTTLVAVPLEGDITVDYEAEPLNDMGTHSVLECNDYDTLAKPTVSTESIDLPLVVASEPYLWRGIRVVEVKVHPVQYDYPTKKLSATSSISVFIESSTKWDEAGMTVEVSDSSWEILSATVANFDALAAAGSIALKQPFQALGADEEGFSLDTLPCGDYLIIAADGFMTNTDLTVDFVDHLTDQGFTPVTWGLCEVDPSCSPTKEQIRTKIRTDCEGAYPEYLLLVGIGGDATGPGGYFIPIHYFIPNLSKHTDNYYCQVGTEEFQGTPPDIVCGRIPVSSQSELSQIIYKSMAYEDTTDTVESRSITIVSDDDHYAESTADTMNDILITGGFSLDLQFESRLNSSVQSIIDAFSSGRNAIVYIGHGENDAWLAPMFYTEDISKLETSSTNPPLVIALSCATNPLYSGNSIAVNMLAAESKGAIGYYGASCRANPNTAHSLGIIFAEEYGVLEYSGAAGGSPSKWRMGSLLDRVEALAFLDLGGTTGNGFVAINNFNLIGDPSHTISTKGEDLLADWPFEANLDSDPRYPDDISAWGRYLTTYGAASPTYSGDHNGNAVEMDGSYFMYTSIYQKLPEITSALTVAFWMKAEDGYDMYPIARGPYSSDIHWGVRVDGAADTLKIEINDGTGTIKVYGIPFDGFGEWHHVAFTFDDSAYYKVKLFLDGEIEKADGSTGLSQLPDGTEYLFVGQRGNLSSMRYHGLLDEIRIYGVPLTEGEIKELYEMTSESLVAHYSMMTSAVIIGGGLSKITYFDHSGNENNQIVPSANQSGTEVPGIEGVGCGFQGATGIAALDTESMTIAGAVSIAAWVYFDSDVEGSIIEKQTEYELAMADGSIIATIASSCTASVPFPAEKRWHHVAMSYQQDAGELTLYLDGKEAVTESCGATIPNSTSPLELASGLVGMIDEVYVYRTPLSFTNLAALAKLGSKLLSMPLGDKSGADLSGHGNDGFVYGTDPVTGIDGAPETATQFQASSMDYIEIPSDQTLVLDDESFSITAWVKPETPVNGYVLAKGYSPVEYGIRLDSSGDRIYWYVAGALYAAAFSNYGYWNDWNFIALTYNQWEGKVRLCINGGNCYTVNRGAEQPEGSRPLYIGAKEISQGQLSYYMNGAIDEIIIQGVPLSTDQLTAMAHQPSGTLLGSWKFDYMIGDYLYDATPYDNDLTYLGEDDPYLLGPSFEGSSFLNDHDDYAETDESISVLDTLDAGFTISFFADIPANATDDIFIEKATSFSLGHTPPLRTTTDLIPYSTIDFGLVTADAQQQLFEKPIFFSAFNHWVNLIISFDRPSKVLSVVQDGFPVFAGTVEGALAKSLSPLMVTAPFGAHDGGGGQMVYSEGRIDKVKLFGTPMNLLEAKELALDECFYVHFKMDETVAAPVSGSMTLDEGPLGLMGFLEGDAELDMITNWQGPSLHLDGSGDYLTLSDNQHLDDIDKHLTLSVRVKPAGNANGYVVAKDSYVGGGVYDGPFELRVYTTRSMYAVLRLIGDDGTYSYLSTSIPYDTAWHSIQATYDGTLPSDNVKLYIDGILKTTASFTKSLDSSDHPILVGHRPQTTGYYFTGRIDDLFISSRTLEEKELAQLQTDTVIDLPLTTSYLENGDYCESSSLSWISPVYTCKDLSPFERKFVSYGAVIDPVNDMLYFDDPGDVADIYVHEVDTDLASYLTISFTAIIPEGEYGTLLLLDNLDASSEEAMKVSISQINRLCISHMGGPVRCNDLSDIIPDIPNDLQVSVDKYNNMHQIELIVNGIADVYNLYTEYPSFEPLHVILAPDDFLFKLKNLVVKRMFVW